MRYFRANFRVTIHEQSRNFAFLLLMSLREIDVELKTPILVHFRGGLKDHHYFVVFSLVFSLMCYMITRAIKATMTSVNKRYEFMCPC